VQQRFPEKEGERAPETRIVLHNVMLHEDSVTTLRISWLRGRLARTPKARIVSLDDKESFSIEVDAGVVSTNTGDLTTLLNTRVFSFTGSPLRNIHVSTKGSQLKVSATLHKGIDMPIELVGDVSATSDGKIRLHPAKLHALHVPVKGLMTVFGVKLTDLINRKRNQGNIRRRQ
jgi:hypothetical protein